MSIAYLGSKNSAGCVFIQGLRAGERFLYPGSKEYIGRAEDGTSTKVAATPDEKGVILRNTGHEVDVELEGRGVFKGWSPWTEVKRIFVSVPTVSTLGVDTTSDVKDKEIPKRIFAIKSMDKMAKKQWQKEKKPKWWVRIGHGAIHRFLNIPEVAGCEILDIKIDLDKEYVPPGETVYFGVGSLDKGFQDEFPRSIKNPEKIVWWLKPRTGELTDVSDYWVWWSKCQRYRIVRNVPRKGEDCYADTFCFVAVFGKNAVLLRSPNMEACFEEIAKDAIKRYEVESITTNADDLLMEASMAGLDFLPDRPAIVETRIVPIVEDHGEKPKKDKKLGVTKEIIALLEKATKKQPVTKEAILDSLIDLFPDKSVQSLVSTISARLADLPKRYNVKGLKKTKKGYWVDT